MELTKSTWSPDQPPPPSKISVETTSPLCATANIATGNFQNNYLAFLILSSQQPWEVGNRVKIPKLWTKKTDAPNSPQPFWGHTVTIRLSQGSEEEVHSYLIPFVLLLSTYWLLSKLFMFISMVIRYRWQTSELVISYFLSTMKIKPGLRTFEKLLYIILFFCITKEMHAYSNKSNIS